MIYLLDTNAWIIYLDAPSSTVRAHLEAHAPNEIATCSVVKAELYFGAYNSSRRASNLAVLSNVFHGVRSYPFDDAAAHIYGQIRADLGKRGTPIGPNDLMICAIALANNLALVTHNVSEFRRVPGLHIEDWQA